MRILMLHEDQRVPGQGGGAESLLRDETQALRAIGHEVAWLHSGKIEEAVKAFRPDVVHVSTIHNFIGLEPARWLQAHAVPHVWALMDYWPFCRPRMLLVDGDRSCSAVAGKCDNACGGRECLTALVNGSPVIALNRYTGEIYRRNGLRVDHVVELGVDTEVFAPDPAARDAEVTIYTSTAWYGQPPKGMRYLQEAVKGMPWRVRVVTGQPRENVAKALKRAHVYVFPSVYEETWGLCLNEAMASGLPCIASDVAGARAQIDDGETGVLVPPRDPQALREAIEWLMAERGWREGLGAEARRHVLADHTLDAMGRRLEAVYREVIG